MSKLGNFIYLVSKPNYTQANGVEVQFQRGTDYFVVSDTDTNPGFAARFHRLISLYAALDFTETHDKERRSAKIRKRIGRVPDGNDPGEGMLKDLVKFYGDRDRDGADSLSLQKQDYGAVAMSEDFVGNNPKQW